MTLDELYKDGAIKYLFDRGLLSPTIMEYFRYFEEYKYHRNTYGRSYREAVTLTSIKFNRSEDTIKRAVRMLRV